MHILQTLQAQLDRLNSRVEELEQLHNTTADAVKALEELCHEHVAPVPRRAGSLVKSVAAAIKAMEENKNLDWEPEAKIAILAVADWLDTVGNNGSARDLREEVKRYG